MCKPILLLLTSLLIVGCTGYQGAFDCPPVRGVGCMSVSEIESSIIEVEDGEDIFSISENKDCNHCRLERKKENFRVWVCNEGDPSTGRYRYFSEEE